MPLQLWKNIRKLISRHKHNLEVGNCTFQKFLSSGMVIIPGYLNWKGEEGETDAQVSTVYGSQELHK